MITRFLKICKCIFRKYPLSVQCLQTGLLVGIGDAVCQSIVENTPIVEFNSRRALEFFGIGTFVIVRINKEVEIIECICNYSRGHQKFIG